MDTKNALVMAALELIERQGESHFSTRAVCDIAKVTAPTLYHHFGNADGLLSAAIAEAFEQFLMGKRAAVQSADAVTAFCEGWDNYVDFAASRPRLYAAMMTRFMSGADLPAAREGQAMLSDRIAKIGDSDRLAVPHEAAVQIAWASANAAAMLHVATAIGQLVGSRPDPATIQRLRDCAVRIICQPSEAELSKCTYS